MKYRIDLEDVIEALPIDGVIEYIVEKYTEEVLEKLDFDDIEEFYLKYK